MNFKTIIKSVLIIFFFLYLFAEDLYAGEPYWPIQSVDTMKYSRDLAREKINDKLFEEVIDRQISQIAQTGATHAAIGTPYDDEFIPFLEKWVDSARKHGLSVWFRGNFSGWEGWFGYEPIDREEHLEMIRRFILNNPSLFEDGDIFTSCTECENGGPGDPRTNGDLRGFRSFLVDEYEETRDAFSKVGKEVASNYFSMNGDVAYLVMDKNTTEKLDGIVVIDHYVDDPVKLSKDVRAIIQKSGGQVVLGEFGAPIPNIHGYMSEEIQAQWIDKSLTELSQIEGFYGINYWTSFGGTTSIWNTDGEARKTVNVLTGFYTPKTIEGRVINELGRPVKNAKIVSNSKEVLTDSKGEFKVLIIPSIDEIRISSKSYKEAVIGSEEFDSISEIVLGKEKENIFFKLQKAIYQFIQNITN